MKGFERILSRACKHFCKHTCLHCKHFTSWDYKIYQILYPPPKSERRGIRIHQVTLNLIKTIFVNIYVYNNNVNILSRMTWSGDGDPYLTKIWTHNSQYSWRYIELKLTAKNMISQPSVFFLYKKIRLLRDCIDPFKIDA